MTHVGSETSIVSVPAPFDQAMLERELS